MDRTSTELRPSVPLRTVLLSVVGVWATYFVIATLRWELMGVGFRIEMMEARSLVTIAGMAVTLVFWALLRLFDHRSLWMKVIAALLIAMPISFLMAQINSYVFSGMDERMEAAWNEKYDYTDPFVDVKMPKGDDGEFGVEVGVDIDDQKSGEAKSDGSTKPADAGGAADPEAKKGTHSRMQGEMLPDVAEDQGKSGVLTYLEPLTEVAFARYFMMLAWSALYLALLTGEKARVAERREQEFRSAAKAAELRSLRYQVNPHFLFNTLNSLSALVMTGKNERAETMIQTISNFYRHSLADDPTSDVPLEQEFDLQRLYLTIEEVRFPQRLRTVYDLPHDLADARVPGMILQPLVENSVKYAVSPVSRPVTITLAAREEFDRLVVSVSDDGPGGPEDCEHGFGIGLANVRDRLEARFGPDVTLTSGSTDNGYTSEIRIPLTRNG